jgi:hypothetical protein
MRRGVLFALALGVLLLATPRAAANPAMPSLFPPVRDLLSIAIAVVFVVMAVALVRIWRGAGKYPPDSETEP